MGLKPLLKLNERHEAYCLGRVAGRPMVDAYMEAGFKASRPNARKEASRLEQEPLIAARLKVLWAAKFKDLHMTADEVLARVAMLARTNAQDVLDADGCVPNVQDLPLQHAVQLAGLEITEEFGTVNKKRVKVGQKTKVRLRDPAPYLRLLAEHHKIVKAPDEGLNALAGAIADRLKAARERKRKESPS